MASVVPHQPLGPVGREPLCERAQVLAQRLAARGRGWRRRSPRRRRTASGHRPFASLSKPGKPVFSGTREQAPVEAVRPAVVGAAQRLAAVARAVERRARPGGGRRSRTPAVRRPCRARRRSARRRSSSRRSRRARAARSRGRSAASRGRRSRAARPGRTPGCGTPTPAGCEVARRSCRPPPRPAHRPELVRRRGGERRSHPGRRAHPDQRLAAPVVHARGQAAGGGVDVHVRRDRPVGRRPRRSAPPPARASGRGSRRPSPGRPRCAPRTATSRSTPPSWCGWRGRRRPTSGSAARPARARWRAWRAAPRRRRRPGRRRGRTPPGSRRRARGSSSARARSRRRPRGRRPRRAPRPRRCVRSHGRLRRG